MTTIQRQYSLPNCTLILEGFGDMANFNPTELRPVMALLLNAECHLEGLQKPLTGGREFFESLVTAVSLYAQERLSGIHLPSHVYSDKPSMVSLKQVGPDIHELSYQPIAPEGSKPPAPQVVNMSSVQLFDLVEAIDQFVADTQTLPFWSLNLAPVARKYTPRSPMVKQSLPAVMGLSSLAIAGGALFMMPTPEIKAPELRLTAQTAEKTSASPSPNASPSPSDPAQVETALKQVPAITDPAEIDKLGQGLQDLLTQNRGANTTIPEDLVYRVSVGKDGKILGYKHDGEAARLGIDRTPLAKLRFIPVEGLPIAEGLADYRVTFKPDGAIEVKPWSTEVATSPSPEASPSPEVSPSPEASPSPSPVPEVSPSPSPSPEASPSPSPSPEASPSQPSGTVSEILEGSTLEVVQPKLRSEIITAWKDTPLTYNENLRFRVRVNKDGKVLDYEADNQAANRYANEVPLPKLGKVADPNSQPSEDFATFKVVFRPSGVVEVSPWYGYGN